MPYLIRVRLPDEPGALGRLATALGQAGADIEQVAVVDRVGGEAVDDLIVDLAPPARAEALVTAVVSVPRVVLETIQPHPGRTRVHDELALLDQAASSRTPVDVVVHGLRDLLLVHYALAIDAAADPALVAASAGAPEAAVLTAWLPLRAARELGADELFDDVSAAGPDAALVAAPIGDRAALVIARNGGAAFRPAEVLRFAHLAHLVRLAVQRA